MVTVRYGPISAPWHLLEAAAFALSQLKRKPSAGQTKLEPEIWKLLLLLESRISSIQRIRRNWQLEGATSLGYLLHEFSNRRASDDRDKVFGLLSLSKPGHGVVPDYTLDVAEIYRDTALSLIESSSSLDVWIGDQRRRNSKELPSCVPDWSAIFHPSNTRRLEIRNAYDVSDGWNIPVVRNDEDYLSIGSIS